MDNNEPIIGSIVFGQPKVGTPEWDPLQGYKVPPGFCVEQERIGQHEMFPIDPALRRSLGTTQNYEALNEMASHFHTRSRAKGFYTDLQTGLPKERNVAEMQMLMVSEIAEMMEGVRKDQMDTHLPHRKMEEVEAADLFIRLMDYCGYRGLDLAGAVREKEAYNEQRADHSLKNRAAAGGKKF